MIMIPTMLTTDCLEQSNGRCTFPPPCPSPPKGRRSPPHPGGNRQQVTVPPLGGGGGTVHHSRPANSSITQLKIFFGAFGL